MTVLGPTPRGKTDPPSAQPRHPETQAPSPAAAARIDLSAEQWGYVERGYYPARDGNPAAIHPHQPRH